MESELGVLPRHWWAFSLRGVAAVVFGIVALVWPALTLGVLIVLFGAWVFVNGIMAIISAIRSGGDHVWSFLIEGALGIAAGVAILVWPALTALILVYIIAAFAVITGVLEIVSAIRMRQIIEHDWIWMIGGALSIIFGLILMIAPGPGAVALVWLIALWAILYGMSMFALSWHLHELDQGHERRGGTPLQQPVAP